ncbi:MAG: hypothetical protein QOE05_3132 [Actinomycetota bacterium]|nr:hypothetical protein [Actinomycetota bacterium]
MKVDGAVALVTGGGGLLGSATVARLVEQGAAVLVADMAPGRATALTEQYGEERVRFCKTDVTEEASVVAAVEEATSLGMLRVVVNCAGAGIVQRTLSRDGTTHDIEAFRRQVELNLVGTFIVLTHTAKAMSANPPQADAERGVIINTSSLAGLEGSAGQIAYGAAKAGVAGLTLPAARDLAPVGIRVLTIAPGGMADADFQPNERTQQVLDNVPHPRRFGTPADFALLVTQLVEHPYLNGSVIRLDGGARLGLKY